MTFDCHCLTDSFFVRGQISPADLPQIKEAGFKAIIINRPDGEAHGQPEADLIKTSAEAFDLPVVYIPMAGQISMDMIEDTRSAIGDLPGPVLAYCAGGMRSAALWCLAQVRELGVERVLETSQNAGFPLEHLRPALEQLSQDD